MPTPTCFRDYFACVQTNDVWDVPGNLDCGLGLADCVWDTFLMDVDSGGGPDLPTDDEQRERLRTILEGRQEELLQLNQRIRDLGDAAEADEALLQEIDQFFGSVNEQAGRPIPQTE